MLSLSSSHHFELYTQPCDMRKSFDALSGLVRNELGRDPANGEVFVFVNRIRTCIKLLHWESGGFVLYYKRLEKGTFSMPRADEKSQRLRWPDLVLMIEGMEVKQLVEKSRYKQENQ